METRINVAELLENCPKGMELYSTIYGTVYFEGVRDTGHAVLIDVKNSIAIKSALGYTVYCALREGGDFYLRAEVTPIRLATEEKQKLLQVIKKNGYKWNAERKCLEKLIEPKFKVGDRIQYKGPYYKPIYIIKSLGTDRYIFDNDDYIKFGDEDNYSLLKFDISTLKPFKSEVLARDSNTEKWKPVIWGFYDKEKGIKYPYKCCGFSYTQCIPYEGNEHLLGKTDDCDEYYKNWED